jgi:glycerol-3-phosphate dehydrogenase
MRDRSFDTLGAEVFDVLIVGGGINGCGIARDAALRGLRTALVEREDFASGTSSRSSRLIHGGVRYLEHGYLHLVFESSRERRTLLRAAPHLVRPLAFTWPVYLGARIPLWKLGAGLLLYDVLAIFRNVHRHRRLSAADVLEHEPALRHDGLTGGALYYDAATDDARLTLANAVAARAAGATLLNHAAVTGLANEDGGRDGRPTTRAIVRDTLGGRQVDVRARVVVNAAGPYSEDVRRLTGDVIPPRASAAGTKGVHILLPRERVGNRDAVTLLSPVDGRVMFALPAGAHTIIGTTDTVTTEHPDAVRASADDIDYLLRSANAFFADARLTTADVISAWAGIRPLADPRFADDPSHASREHVIVRDGHGMISVTGGKLTTYRAMAATVVDQVVEALGRPRIRCETAQRPLPGGDLASLTDEITSAIGALRLAPSLRSGSPIEAIATRLVQAHGNRWRGVWAFAEREPPLAAEPLSGLPYLAAEFVYAVIHEMASTLGDLLIRRIPVAFETPDHGLEASHIIARIVAPRLGWSDEERDAQVTAFQAESRRIFGDRA